MPNGRELGDPHLAYKLDWLARLRDAGAGWLAADPQAQIALMGDWNIAPQDDDVWSMDFYEGKTHVSAPERAAFAAVVEAGFTDPVRPLLPGPGTYTYWDYTQLSFPKKRGMRIDFALCSPALAARVTGALIDREERKGKGAERPRPGHPRPDLTPAGRRNRWGPSGRRFDAGSTARPGDGSAHGSPCSKTPVVFIHGLWLHSSSWQPWAELFQAAGHPTYTPEWPGVPDTVEATRAHPEAQAGKGLVEIIKAHADFLLTLDEKPIIIGHSFGGLIVQSLMGESLGAAGVAIDPAQIRGVLPLPIAQLRSALPGLGNPLNYKKSVSLTEAQFRYGFANAVSEEESKELYDEWTIPSPARPLFEAAMANFNPHSPAKVHTHNNTRGPLLLISGRQDHTVPGRRDPLGVQALQALDRGDRAQAVRPRALADHRQRLARDRPGRAGLAGVAGPRRSGRGMRPGRGHRPGRRAGAAGDRTADRRRSARSRGAAAGSRRSRPPRA